MGNPSPAQDTYFLRVRIFPELLHPVNIHHGATTLLGGANGSELEKMPVPYICQAHQARTPSACIASPTT